MPLNFPILTLNLKQLLNSSKILNATLLVIGTLTTLKKRIYLALNIKKARTTGSIISVVGKSTVEIMEPFLV